MYGDWSVEDEDVREVVAYRAGLNVAALGTGLHHTTVLCPLSLSAKLVLSLLVVVQPSLLKQQSV